VRRSAANMSIPRIHGNHDIQIANERQLLL
jgi:hypothetical protein